MKLNYKTISILGFVSGVIFFMPYYFKYLFINFPNNYISGLELERIYFIYGIATILFYLPGGYLADRYSCKKLIEYSSLISGVFGIISLFDIGYLNLMIVFIIFAISNILLFWSASIKYVLNLGDKYESGRILGIYEGFKGVSGLLFICLYFIFYFKGFISIKTIVFIYSLINIFLYFYIKKEVEKDSIFQDKTQLLIYLKNKKIWIIGGIIFLNYTLYINMMYMNNYLSYFYQMTDNQLIIYSCMRIYILKIILGPLSGYFMDKLGSALKLFFITFFIYIFVEIIYISTPSNYELKNFILVNLGIITGLSTIFNTIFFGLISEFNFKVTGKIIGLVSTIGFLPGIFYTKITEILNKSYAMEIYKYFFLLNISVSFLGLIIVYFAYKIKNVENK